MSIERERGGRKFGTMPVFLTAISTILGAIMFLRFGYAVGNVGFFGALAVIVVGHLVTIPTALAIAEIATNQKVEGGGEYFIISRSFGLTVGGAIGIALFLSQAISVAFYLIAFAEAFDPVFAYVRSELGWTIADKRLVSIPSMVLLAMLMLKKGADLGVKLLYLVVGVLFVSLLLFFMGTGADVEGTGFQLLSRTVEKPDTFFYVFAICFPAFTGMTAGVGLSGDLRDPKTSIPLGTLAATISGMVIYILIAYKLATSAAPEALNQDQLIMSKIALWGPIIPIGLACATLSSALGSLMVAPRTLQAIGGDGLFPTPRLNGWVAAGKWASNEPVNATWVTCVIALGILAIGDVNLVAEIISMFFMVTYGSICLISFLEHFAADPSYRPTFTTRWYVSLFGALICGFLMFRMNPGYALFSVIIMAGIYLLISYYNPDKAGLSAIMKGVIFQISRQLQVFLQGAREGGGALNWRPSIVCISKYSFQRQSAFDMVRWMSYHYGFGTYMHLLKGYLSRETHLQSREVLARLIRLAGASKGRVFVDTMVSPSQTTAICQVIQLPGVSGHENNGLLLEFCKRDPEESLRDIVTNIPLVLASDFDVYVLASSERKFGYRKEIHIWLTPYDYENGSLMILTGYILLGDPDWRKGTLKIMATYPEDQLKEEEERLRKLIVGGRLPIAQHNIHMMSLAKGGIVKQLINRHSQEADLVIRGFRADSLKRGGEEVFTGYDEVGDVLFINSCSEKKIASVQELVEAGAILDAAAVDSAAVDSAAVDAAAVDADVEEKDGAKEEKPVGELPGGAADPADSPEKP